MKSHRLAPETMDKGRRAEFAPNAKDVEYEPPQVEEVLSADDLSREVHYAAGAAVSDFTLGG